MLSVPGTWIGQTTSLCLSHISKAFCISLFGYIFYIHLAMSYTKAGLILLGLR
jgi:hypothetical protein